MTQERLNHIAVTSCHSEIVKNLDSNKLYDEFIKEDLAVRINVFSLNNHNIMIHICQFYPH